MIRRRAVFGFAVLLTLALGAPAVSHAASLQLTTRKPIKVAKHFKLSLFANQGFQQPGFPPGSDSVDATFVHGGETAAYDFSKGIKFTGRQDMSTAHVKGSFAKHRGLIKMGFKATGKKHNVPVPKGCTGSPGSGRNGILKGKFRLRADKLGTVRIKRTKATLETPPTIEDCTGGGGGGASHGSSVDGGRSTKKQSINYSAFKPRSGGHTEETVAVTRFGKGWDFNWFLTSRGPRSAYKSTNHLTRATVKGVGRMSGTAKYKGKKTSPNSSTGKSGGNLVAHFASLGNFRVFKSGKLQGSQAKF
jgi:hypothetical protein